MNEVPAGLNWPSPEEQLARTEEALTIITRLLDGERVTFDGRFFKTKDAVAELADRVADGLWTLGDPQQTPAILKAYRNAAVQEPHVLLQAVFSYAGDDEQALEAARKWKGTLVDRHYTDDIADPAEIYRNGEDEVPDELFTEQVICSSDPETHVQRIKTIAKLGGDVVVLMNVSGADPHAALRVYGEQVVPKLRNG